MELLVDGSVVSDQAHRGTRHGGVRRLAPACFPFHFHLLPAYTKLSPFPTRRANRSHERLPATTALLLPLEESLHLRSDFFSALVALLLQPCIARTSLRRLMLMKTPNSSCS